MFIIRGWINIGPRNHKRAGKTENRERDVGEMKQRRGIFFSNYS